MTSVEVQTRGRAGATALITYSHQGMWHQEHMELNDANNIDLYTAGVYGPEGARAMAQALLTLATLMEATNAPV